MVQLECQTSGSVLRYGTAATDDAVSHAGVAKPTRLDVSETNVQTCESARIMHRGVGFMILTLDEPIQMEHHYSHCAQA